MGAFLLRSGFAHVDNVITKRCSKQSHGCSCQGCKATNHTGTLLNLPNHWNSPPEPSGSCLQNLHQHTPEPSGTCLRNLPPEPASGTYTSTHRNSREPFGTCLQNLHRHTPELSGTFWNLPPEPAPATRTGTHRSLSGLKTPLAYAVGEKQFLSFSWEFDGSFAAHPNEKSLILLTGPTESPDCGGHSNSATLGLYLRAKMSITCWVAAKKRDAEKWSQNWRKTMTQLWIPSK